MITSENLFEKGVLVAVHSGYYEGRQKLDEDQLKDLPTEIVRGVHDIFDKNFKEKIREIGRHNGETRSIIKRKSVPFPLDGVYFIMSDRIGEIVEMVEAREKEKAVLVQKAVEMYDEAIADFKKKFPDFYERAKGRYISKEEFARRFYFNYQFVKVSAPDKTSMISPAQFKAEQQKFKGMVEEMKQEVLSTIYESLLSATSRLKKQCEDDRFNEATLKSLNKFIDKIDEVYSEFVDSKSMREAIKKIKANILGITAEELRSKEDLKAEFAKNVGALINDLKAMPDIPTKRALDF
jgi:hypothetical protein